VVLRGLQTLLGRLYDLSVEHDVYDFLVTDRRALAGVVPANDRREPDEELLLAETADGAGVALYIDPAVLARLEAADPLGALTEGNLADYCTALEGVSHFLYSIWRLECDVPISLLELECQAEVDKYAATVFLVGCQQGGSYPAQVHARLFDRVEFDTSSAANFCRRLERRFVSRGTAKVEPLVRELRKFYRLGSAAKLHYAIS